MVKKHRKFYSLLTFKSHSVDDNLKQTMLSIRYRCCDTIKVGIPHTWSQSLPISVSFGITSEVYITELQYCSPVIIISFEILYILHTT